MAKNDATDRAAMAMAREIEKRMKSDEWDRLIAAAVLRRKRRGRIKAIAASIVPFAAAAAVILAVVMQPHGAPEQNGYASFIESQVMGAYRAAYNGADTITPNNDVIDTRDVDEAIESAFVLQ